MNVFFMPCGDILFRALQFSDWMRDKYKDKVRIINFETELIVNPENLEDILNNSNKNEKLILLAKRVFMRPDGSAMASVLEQWYAEQGMGALILHEGFPTELTRYIPRPVMTQQQLVHAVYPYDVAVKYAETTAKLFEVAVESKQVEQIVRYCGGIPWLINDVLRRLGEDNLFENEVLQWKVGQIAQAIPNIPGIEKDLASFELRNDKGEWLPILGDYLDRLAKNSLEISSEKLVYDGRDLSHIFSAGERRIMAYLTSTEGVVKREQLGLQFWQDQSEAGYSDWALDAIMSRLRKKIVKLGLPLKIKTRRGQGYECA